MSSIHHKICVWRGGIESPVKQFSEQLTGYSKLQFATAYVIQNGQGDGFSGVIKTPLICIKLLHRQSPTSTKMEKCLTVFISVGIVYQLINVLAERDSHKYKCIEGTMVLFPLHIFPLHNKQCKLFVTPLSFSNHVKKKKVKSHRKNEKERNGDGCFISKK